MLRRDTSLAIAPADVIAYQHLIQIVMSATDCGRYPLPNLGEPLDCTYDSIKHMEEKW